MKNIILLTLCAAVYFTACKDDVLDFEYDPGRMHYDGPNFTAPFLPAGTTEASAMFPDKVLDLYEGKFIDGIELSIYDIPEACTLIIYGDGSGNTPGPVIYEEDIRSILEPGDGEMGKWNTITLPSPIPIPSSGDIWVALRSTQSVATQVIGCDAGPSKDNGDWLYESSDGLWRTFLDRGGDDINWNMRAVID
jgi:hypothetical protein